MGTVAVIHYGYRELTIRSDDSTTPKISKPGEHSGGNGVPQQFISTSVYKSFSTSSNTLDGEKTDHGGALNDPVDFDEVIKAYQTVLSESAADQNKEKTFDPTVHEEIKTTEPRVSVYKDPVPIDPIIEHHEQPKVEDKEDDILPDNSVTSNDVEQNKPADNIPEIKNIPVQPDPPKRDLSILYKESPEVFSQIPSSYLPDYKSFCWYDKQNKFQCLSSVYLAGMPKCGTTDLYDKLMWHPQLTTQAHRKDPTANQKEFFYWTRGRLARPESHVYTPREKLSVYPFSTFLAGTGSEKVRANKEVRIVDGTPCLLWDLRGWEDRYGRGLEEPPYSNADLIHSVTPEAKILVIVREPVERLYSEYIYFWSGYGNDRNPTKFDREARDEVSKFNRCLEKWSLRRCCYSSDFSLRLRLALGIYVCYVRDFYELFGDRLLVVTMSEYHDYPVETVMTIFKHIGVSEVNSADLKHFIETSRAVNTNTDRKKRVGEMLDETKEFLKAFYAPYNSQLATLLKDDKYLF